LSTTQSGATGSSVSVTIPANTTGYHLGPTGFANYTTSLNTGPFIPNGFWDMNIFASTDTAGAAGSHCSIYWALYGVNGGGSPTQIGTNSSSAIITSTTSQQYTLTSDIPYTNLAPYNILEVKIFGNNNDTGGGGARPITLYYEDSSTYSHIHTSFASNSGSTGPTGPQGPTGSKSFIIDHPQEQDKYLVHVCLEGPETGVYYRGDGKITDNISTTIVLPNYVKNLAHDFTIQITPIFNGGEQITNYLRTSRVENNMFTVYGENCEFFWLVQGKRGDIEVEPFKTSVDVKGTGPYRWI
jgi:hypothetical protein